MNDTELIAAHLLYLRRINARPATMQHREAALRRIGGQLPCPLLAVDTETLWRWQDGERTRLAVTSVRCYTSHVRAFYGWAHRAGHLSVDPSADLQTPRTPPARGRPIGEDALRVAIRCAPQPVKMWLILAAFCGLRAGEIARLRREDIDDEVLDVDGKGGKPRTVPLPRGVRTALLEHVAGPGVIWRKHDGTPMTPTKVSERCSRHLQVVGAGCSLHKLRHRYGTRLYELSRDPLMVQNLLGHASLDTTMIYLGVNADRARSVTDELAQTLGHGRDDDGPPSTAAAIPA